MQKDEEPTIQRPATVRFPARLKAQLKKEVAARQEIVGRTVTMEEILEEAFINWQEQQALAREGGGTTKSTVLKIPVENLENRDTNYQSVTGLVVPAEKCMELLRDILSSGHQVAVSAISHNLIAFDLLVKQNEIGASSDEPKDQSTSAPDPDLETKIETAKRRIAAADEHNRKYRQGAGPNEEGISGPDSLPPRNKRGA